MKNLEGGLGGGEGFERLFYKKGTGEKSGILLKNKLRFHKVRVFWINFFLKNLRLDEDFRDCFQNLMAFS